VSSPKHGPPRVITGTVAASAAPTYRRCEDEPIHTPGAIQSFGALIGLQYNQHGDLEVRIASENARKVLGYGPEQLFTLVSFLDILKHEDRDEMIARVDHALSNVDAIKDETRLDVFQMTLTFPYEPDARLWCAIHLAPHPKGMVVCEFEEYMDAFYLKDVGAAKILPIELAPPTDVETSPEDLRKSTTSNSKPLAALKIARHKQNKEFSPLDVFNTMIQAQKQIADCKDVQSILDVAVGIISELTGFHRVMFYSFDSQNNGCIDAELLNYKANTVLFRGMYIRCVFLYLRANIQEGLHFPASDIPKQARELYRINRIRVLHDRDAETARLVSLLPRISFAVYSDLSLIFFIGCPK
jgi:light-regulated signal transduction histidine kinase (bacteriophytochrome)